MEESISSSRTSSAFFNISVHSAAAPSDDSGWTAYFHDDYHLLPPHHNTNHPHRAATKANKGSEESKKMPPPEPAEDPLQDTASSPLNATPFQQLQDGCHIAECEEGETVNAAATECRTARQWDHWDGPGAQKGGGVCLISPCYCSN